MLLLLSDPDYAKARHNFVNKLLNLDTELMAESCGKEMQAKEIYQIFR